MVQLSPRLSRILLIASTLEHMVQLHEDVRIYYVVDSYKAAFTTDDGNTQIADVRGATIGAALINLFNTLKRLVDPSWHS